MALSGAMQGWPFQGLLDNATMVATRPRELVVADNGQETGANPQTIRFRCYLKRNNGVIADNGSGDGFGAYEGGGGIDPERTDKVDGFADRVLPSWVLKQSEIICESDDLGEGVFYPLPNVRPARGLVEAQTGSYLYGTFLAKK
jgi:hypothetical protein